MHVFYATGFAITFNEEAFLVELEFVTETEKQVFCLVVSLFLSPSNLLGGVVN